MSLKQYFIEKPKNGTWDPKIKELITMMSYGDGNVIGNYAITHHHLDNILKDSSVFDKYALVEKKTDYYILMLDFDFKIKNEDVRKCIITKSHENSIYILNKFLEILKSETSAKNREFVYLENFINDVLNKFRV